MLFEWPKDDVFPGSSCMRLLTRALAARTANRAAAVRLLVFFLAATFIVEVTCPHE